MTLWKRAGVYSVTGAQGSGDDVIIALCVGEVLCFLYENCVPIETWTDVLEELLPAGTIKITRESETV